MPRRILALSLLIFFAGFAWFAPPLGAREPQRPIDEAVVSITGIVHTKNVLSSGGAATVTIRGVHPGGTLLRYTLHVTIPGFWDAG